MIETIGYIKKEEHLVSLEHDIIPNTQVIETREPFPGYHGKDLPGELSASAPEFVFFVTKQKYTTEHIARISQNIRKYFNGDIDIARAEINIFNNKYPCIRVKNCKDFSKIVELQTCYQGEGIKFAKKMKVDTLGQITIQKHFNMEQMAEGIFKDLDEENTSYLQIPIEIKWPQFKRMTLKIKNNMDNNNFDAALGLFYRKGGLADFIRIYDKNADIKRLEDLKTRYMNEISRVLLNS